MLGLHRIAAGRGDWRVACWRARPGRAEGRLWSRAGQGARKKIASATNTSKENGSACLVGAGAGSRIQAAPLRCSSRHRALGPFHRVSYRRSSPQGHTCGRIAPVTASRVVHGVPSAPAGGSFWAAGVPSPLASVPSKIRAVHRGSSQTERFCDCPPQSKTKLAGRSCAPGFAADAPVIRWRRYTALAGGGATVAGRFVPADLRTSGRVPAGASSPAQGVASRRDQAAASRKARLAQAGRTVPPCPAERRGRQSCPAARGRPPRTPPSRRLLLIVQTKTA
jgi:hypothetical protein